MELMLAGRFFQVGFGVGPRFFWWSCLQRGGVCRSGSLEFASTSVSFRCGFFDIGVTVFIRANARAVL
jgi:hypothetical protein